MPKRRLTVILRVKQHGTDLWMGQSRTFMSSILYASNPWTALFLSSQLSCAYNPARCLVNLCLLSCSIMAWESLGISSSNAPTEQCGLAALEASVLLQ